MIKKFNQFNKNLALEESCKKFEIKNNFKFLASGQYGKAYESGNKIIKLTSSKDEFEISRSLIKNPNSYCVKYYKAFYLKKYNLYAILMQKASPIKSSEIEFVDDLCGLNYYENISTDDIQEILGKKFTKRQLEIFTQFKKMANSLLKNGISIDDLHAKNIGYVNNKMVHFDPMGISSELVGVNESMSLDEIKDCFNELVDDHEIEITVQNVNLSEYQKLRKPFLCLLLSNTIHISENILFSPRSIGIILDIISWDGYDPGKEGYTQREINLVKKYLDIKYISIQFSFSFKEHLIKPKIQKCLDRFQKLGYTMVSHDSWPIGGGNNQAYFFIES